MESLRFCQTQMVCLIKVRNVHFEAAPPSNYYKSEEIHEANGFISTKPVTEAFSGFLILLVGLGLKIHGHLFLSANLKSFPILDQTKLTTPFSCLHK